MCTYFYLFEMHENSFISVFYLVHHGKRYYPVFHMHNLVLYFFNESVKYMISDMLRGMNAKAEGKERWGVVGKCSADGVKKNGEYLVDVCGERIVPIKLTSACLSTCIIR